jgi:hypothetical protein
MRASYNGNVDKAMLGRAHAYQHDCIALSSVCNAKTIITAQPRHGICCSLHEHSAAGSNESVAKA